MSKQQERADERGFYRVSLRLPLDVHEALVKMSHESERSLNAQIVWCLRRCQSAHDVSKRIGK